MGILGWFKRKDPNDDFESILNELEEAIRVKEEKLAFIKHREQRAVVLFTTYSILAWSVYVAAWWFGILDVATWAGDNDVDGESISNEGILEKAVKTLPVGGVPVLIFFTRRIVRYWYRRKQERENKELTVLRKRQRDQIDKLKKLSNYDKITSMLERHGQVVQIPLKQQSTIFTGTPNAKSRPSSAFSTPEGKGNSLQQGQFTPAQQAIAAGQRNTAMQNQANTDRKAGLQRKIFPAPPNSGLMRLPQQGLNLQVDQTGTSSPPPQNKGFLDRLADAAANVLMGESEQSPASKYALICQRCFAHNGLVLKDEVMDIQFLCPKCGSFNPSRRARMTGANSPIEPNPGQDIGTRIGNTSIGSLAATGVSPILSGDTTSGSRHQRVSSTTSRPSPTTDTDADAGDAAHREEGDPFSIQKDREIGPVNTRDGTGSLRNRGKPGAPSVGIADAEMEDE